MMAEGGCPRLYLGFIQAYSINKEGVVPGVPLTYFNDGRGGGWGEGVKDFFQSEVLAKWEFFRSMKNDVSFCVCEKMLGFWGFCILHQLKSTIT